MLTFSSGEQRSLKKKHCGREPACLLRVRSTLSLFPARVNCRQFGTAHGGKRRPTMSLPTHDERRQTQRHRLGRLASMIPTDGGPPRFCLVTDFSEGGVRVNSK